MRVEFQRLRRAFILSREEAAEEPVQGGEYQASPPVGLQAPLEVLVVVSLVEGSGAEEEEEEEEEEAGGVSIGLAWTIAGADGVEETAWGVMIGAGAWETAAVVVIGAAGCSFSYCFPSSPAQEW